MAGEVNGRVPLLHHEKALIISTTLFKEEAYKADWEKPMTRIIDDWGLRYPGVKKVDHVYFYGVPVADEETRRGFLERPTNWVKSLPRRKRRGHINDRA
jgi:NAD(P)H dehydrogenase (quinone)